MSDTTNFQFNTHAIRVVTIDGEPWFVAKDVCGVLGLTNPTIALRALDDGEKGVSQIKTLGGRQTVNIISESGLYKLVLRSDKPQAKPFQDWVTKEVLPAIRKDGAYIRGEEKLRTGEMSEEEFVLKAISILQAKVDRITAERDAAVGKQEEMRRVFGRAEHTLHRVARNLGDDVNSNLIKRSLENLGYLYRAHGSGTYRVYRKHSALFQERIHHEYGSVEIYATAAGKEKLAELYEAGLLIMKVGRK